MEEPKMAEEHVYDRYARAKSEKQKCEESVDALDEKLMETVRKLRGWQTVGFSEDASSSTADQVIVVEDVPTIHEFRERIEEWRKWNNECRAAVQAMTVEQRETLGVALDSEN